MFCADSEEINSMEKTSAAKVYVRTALPMSFLIIKIFSKHAAPILP